MTRVWAVRHTIVLLVLGALVACDRQAMESGEATFRRLGSVTETDTLIPPSGEEYNLFDATHVSSFSDGSIALLNRGTQEVLVFTVEGALAARFGGPGEGPGEFTRPTFLTVIPGDSVLVMDLFTQRMAVFTHEGSHARTFALDTPPVGEAYVSPVGVTSERLVAATQAVSPVQPNSSPGMTFVPARAIVYDLEGGIASVIEEPDIGGDFFLFEQGGQLQSVAPPFRRSWLMAAGPSGVALASSVSRRILRFDSGARSEATTWLPGEVHALTRSLVDSVRSAWVETPTTREGQVRGRVEEGRRLRGQLVGDIPRPEDAPVIADLQFDQLGRLWAASFRADGRRAPRWYVFDGPSAIGFVEIPADLRVAEIGVDHLLGIATDSLDVQSVVKLHLSWH